jgi:monoterpene epsilon-lactone hydrolase
MSQKELATILAKLQAGAGPTTAFSVEAARATWYSHTDDFVIPDTLQKTSVAIGPMKAEGLQRIGSISRKAVLYLHGGGYVCGSIESHRPLTAPLAECFDGLVLSIDFRLAPEHPFPAAVEDALAGYRYLLERGHLPEEIAIAGDSAGGGLVLGVMGALRSQGLPMPAAGWLISPWSDLTHSGETISGNAGTDPMVFVSTLTESRGIYLSGAAADHPYAHVGPGNAQSFPPLLIQVSATEILLDDALRIARLTSLDGVAVTLEIWPAMVHVWHLFSRDLQEARDAIGQAATWLTTRLSPADQSTPP